MTRTEFNALRSCEGAHEKKDLNMIIRAVGAIYIAEVHIERLHYDQFEFEKRPYLLIENGGGHHAPLSGGFLEINYFLNSKSAPLLVSQSYVRYDTTLGDEDYPLEKYAMTHLLAEDPLASKVFDFLENMGKGGKMEFNAEPSKHATIKYEVDKNGNKTTYSVTTS